jgi:hypothetical protein
MKNSRTYFKVLIHLLLITVTIFCIYPLFVMISGSLKTPSELAQNPGGIPRNPTLENYIKLFAYNSGLILRTYVNAIFIASSHAILTLYISALAAFGFSKYRFNGQRLLFSFLLATLMVPRELGIPPLYIFFSRIGWLDSYQIQIIHFVANVFAMFMLHQYMLRKTMKSKEKLKKSLNHQNATIPVDFGGTSVTGIHCSVVKELREYYGLEKRPVKIHEPYQMLGLVETDLMEAMGVDVIGIHPRNTMFGFPLEDWKEWKTPWGQEVLVPGQFNTTWNNGYIYIYPEGDLQVPASGRMPESGYFFDSIIRQPTLDEDKLNPQDNIEEYSLISDEDLNYLRISCHEAEKTEKGIVATFGGTAFGDIALIPAPGLKFPKGIRDISEWYISTVARQDHVHKIFSRQLEISLSNLERIFNAVGNIPDVVFICGTDFGTQTSQFCSTDTFDTLYAPYYRQVNDWIHQHTTWKTFKHSCGAVKPFMSHFIESGFDIINPVQCSAAGMDPHHLKKTYGQELVFWGGGVDTQKTLPFDSPSLVKQEVLERLKIFGDGGGFIFNSIHNVQAGTPIRNMTVMLDAVREFNEQNQ